MLRFTVTYPSGDRLAYILANIETAMDFGLCSRGVSVLCELHTHAETTIEGGWRWLSVSATLPNRPPSDRKRTGMQTYYLALIWCFRIFGAFFAVGSVAIAASNFMVPASEATGNRATIAIMGVAFFIVGCALCLGATRVLRWYRRQIP